VRERIAIVYNEPLPSRYDAASEGKAVLGVLEAVAAVRRSLFELGHKVTCMSLMPPIEQAVDNLNLQDVSMVFNLFEGFCGYPETEALLPEYLESIGVPYTGCSAMALRLSLDKAKVKVLLRAAGIHTPDFQLLNSETLHAFRLGYPCIVKPRGEDASHGINEASVVGDLTSLRTQVQLASGSYGNALLEVFVGGREFNVTVLGNSQLVMLPVSEIVYSLPSEMPEILTFSAKWEPDSVYFRGTRVVCPAEIDADEQVLIREMALAAFRLLGCRGYARVDMRMDKEGRLNVIEVNPNPDISPDAGAARQAKAAGMSYTRFINKIVQLAVEKETYDCKNTPHVSKGQISPDEHTTRYARVQAV